jgi:hypothetical protein
MGDRRLVIPSRVGTVLYARNVRRELHKACIAAGVPEITPHELRHIAASLMVDDGQALERVATSMVNAMQTQPMCVVTWVRSAIHGRFGVARNSARRGGRTGAGDRRSRVLAERRVAALGPGETLGADQSFDRASGDGDAVRAGSWPGLPIRSASRGGVADQSVLCAATGFGSGLIWVARLSAASCRKDGGCRPWRRESGPTARAWRHVAHEPTTGACQCVGSGLFARVRCERRVGL